MLHRLAYAGVALRPRPEGKPELRLVRDDPRDLHDLIGVALHLLRAVGVEELGAPRVAQDVVHAPLVLFLAGGEAIGAIGGIERLAEHRREALVRLRRCSASLGESVGYRWRERAVPEEGTR